MVFDSDLRLLYQYLGLAPATLSKYKQLTIRFYDVQSDSRVNAPGTADTFRVLDNALDLR